MEASPKALGAVASRLRGGWAPGKLNFMCRMTFAAIAAAAALSPLKAQQVPGRDLFHFPLGTLAEAPALASAAAGGFWNPATLALGSADRMIFSAAALNSGTDEGVSAQIATMGYGLREGFTVGASVALSSVGDLIRTDTDPQSLGSDIAYRSTIISAIAAAERGPARIGLALRRRTGTVDLNRGRATSVDVGATLDRPHGLPFRAAISSFLLSPSRSIERATVLGAVEGYLPTSVDVRAGVSYQQDEGGDRESFAYASTRVGLVDLRGGFARQSAYGMNTTRLRLGLGVHYAHYLVGIAREDGAAGLGANYQFLLTTVIPKVRP